MPPRKSKSRRARGTGSIFFRAGKQRWVGRVPVGTTAAGKTVYRECWGKTQGEVVRKMAAATPPGPEVTLAGWVEHWWGTLTVRPTTRTNYRKHLDGHVLPRLGHLRLAAVTVTQIETLAAQLAGVLASETLKVCLAVTRTVFHAAVRTGLITRNPVSLARKPKRKRRTVEPFTPAELLKVVGAADWYSGGRPIALMAACGCRIGEAMALEVPDFDPAAGTIAITKTAHQDTTGRRLGPPKSPNSVRTIRVPDVILPTLTAAAGKRTAGPLFVTAANRRYAEQMVGHALGLTLDALGIGRRTSHVLRHSVASHLVAANVSVADVAKYLGDSVETIVRTYLHPTGADPADALDRLYGGRKVGGRKGPKAGRAGKA